MATGTIKQTDIGYQNLTSGIVYIMTYKDSSTGKTVTVENCADQSNQTRIIRQGNLYYIYLMVKFSAKGLDPTSHWVYVLSHDVLANINGRFVVYNNVSTGVAAIRISGKHLVVQPDSINVNDIIYGSACILA